MKNMTLIWVIIGASLIGIGTIIMWYFPYKEGVRSSQKYIEKGTFSKKISLKHPRVCNGESCYVITGPQHLPIISMDPNGDGLYSWIQDNEMKLSLTIHNKKHEVITYISSNEWVVNKSSEVDCNYDLNRFEVVVISNNKIDPVLQVELKDDRINLAFKTILSNGMGLFWGNGLMEFPKETENFTESLKPIFQYPSKDNFGKKM